MLRRMLLVATVGAVVAAGALTGAVGASASAGGGAPALDSCPAPSVDIFDLVIPPNPVPAGTTLTAGTPQADQYLQWSDLTTAYGGVSEALINQDPTAGQIEYVDRTIAQANAPDANGTIPDYTPGFDTAPAGAVSGIDYLVEGQITGSQGAWTVTVALEDASTRAHIADGSATFADSANSMAAAQQAASQLTPVLSKIRAYQQKLKAHSSEMAISPPNDQPLLTPANSRINEHQSTKISLSLRDCDGLALAHRTLKLHATHGKISPATVKTDAHGKAHATFTATSHGIAQIRADYGPYQTVTHKRDQRRGTTAIAVNASGVWEVNINASWQERESLDKPDDTARETIQASEHATELIRATNPLGGGSPSGGQASASYSAHFHHSTFDGSSSCEETLSESGTGTSQLPDLLITHTRPRVSLSFQGYVNESYSDHRHCAPYGQDPVDRSATDRTSFSLVAGPQSGWRGSCTLQGNRRHGYTINCGNLSTGGSVYLGDDNGTETTTGRLRITMTPL